MIALTVAALGFASGAPAQKDAAEKAQEGAIDHWIEYYKREQRKPAAAPNLQESAASPADRAAPTEQTGTSSPQEKSN